MAESTTDHEDRLRALGWYLDQRKLCEITLSYSHEGIALTAHQRENETADAVQLRFSPEEIEALCQEGAGRRGSGTVRGARPSRLNALRDPQAPPVPLSQWVDQTHALSYQEALRAVGFDLDRWGARWYRIDEQDQGMVIRYRTTTAGPDINQVYPITRDEVRTRIARSIRRRGSGANAAATGA